MGGWAIPDPCPLRPVPRTTDYFRQVLRAAPITLTNHCLKCHVPDRKSTEDRTAGLIISMPVQ